MKELKCFLLRIEPELYTALKERADVNDRSITKEIVNILKTALKK